MHCLAVLQRLSLRGRLQSKMIHLGALDVVLKLLEPLGGSFMARKQYSIHR